MNNNPAYKVAETDRISVDKMHFEVIGLQPKYNHADAEKVKNEIETKLFNIFKKYVSEL